MEARLEVGTICVKPGKLTCEVTISPVHDAYSSPAIAQALVQARPKLLQHTCKNKKGYSFAAVIEHTSLAHVFEHVAIDYQVEYAPENSVFQFVGTTEWADKSAGRSLVTLNFEDDLQALRALKSAQALLNSILAKL